VVHLQTGDLPPAVALRQGQTYTVSVRGSNAGGVYQGIVVHSGPITVSADG
jgi:hypothetical protein